MLNLRVDNYTVNRKGLKALVRRLSKKRTSSLSEDDREMLALCRALIEELKRTPHNTISFYDQQRY